jgi:hypothetical protein
VKKTVQKEGVRGFYKVTADLFRIQLRLTSNLRE